MCCYFNQFEAYIVCGLCDNVIYNTFIYDILVLLIFFPKFKKIKSYKKFPGFKA